MPTRRPVLLTVCLGNICRSPTAAAAISEAADAAGVEVAVRSAGTGRWHLGEPPDRRMREAAARAGLELSGTGEQVDADAIAEADLVLAMDAHNLAELRRIAQRHGLTTPIRLFREFDPSADEDLDVPDPYYGAADGFAEVVDICRRTAGHLVSVLPDVLDADADAGA